MPSAALRFFIRFEVAQLLCVLCILVGTPVVKEVALRHELIKWNRIPARLSLMPNEIASAKCCESRVPERMRGQTVTHRPDLVNVDHDDSPRGGLAFITHKLLVLWGAILVHTTYNQTWSTMLITRSVVVHAARTVTHRFQRVSRYAVACRMQ